MPRLSSLRRALPLAALLAITLTLNAPVRAQDDEIIADPAPVEREDDPSPPDAATVTNSDFETGSLSGWTIFNSTTGGSWRTHNSPATPLSLSTTYAPPQGTFGAMADMNSPGNFVLYQDIALPAGQRHTLSFILYYSNRWYDNNGNINGFVEPSGTTLTGSQTYRVDLIKTTAAADTMVGSDILANVFRTRAGDPGSMRPTLITFDISAFAGQTVRLRFAAGVHLYYFYPGVDDVRITSNLVITGRVANATGRAIPNATVTLSGSQSATAFTDPVGRYTFDNVPSGGNYTVTPSKSGYTFAPPSQAYTNLTASQTADFTAAGGVTVPTAGQILISRFRTRGALGAFDEFIELYNNTDTDIVVTDPTPPAGTSNGWAIVGGEAPTTAKVIVPSGALIPARGHYLVAQSENITNGYNLTAYAGHDTGYSNGLTDGRGVALFRTANSTLFNAANQLDAVGFAGETNALFKEGTGLQPSAGVTTDVQHVFMRKIEQNTPRDTNNNASDFALVATSGATISGVQPVLGSTGPEDFGSHRLHNNDVALNLVDCGVSAATAPNRLTDTTANGINTKTLKVRRTVVNNTGAPVTRLRFRAAHITTLGTPPEVSTQADVRPVTSSNETVTVVAPCVGTGTSRTVLGLTLDTPPTQASGGGLNSTVSAGTITLRQPLLPGQSIDVNFWLAVVTSGNFRFFINIEAQN
jgi:hypothetical protein